MIKQEAVKKYSIASLVFILFSIFILNGVKESDPDAGLFAHQGEAKIYGRLARSRIQGIFSDSALLGFCDGGSRERTELKYQFHFSSYLNHECIKYHLYKSQSGFQGLVYSVIDYFYQNWIIPKILCTAFLSLVLTAWFIWFWGIFGLTSALFIVFSILSFRSLMIFGGNIAHVLGATYLIIVWLFWEHQKKHPKVYRTVFFALLLKFLLNGPEYVFSALLLPFVPLVFYAVHQRLQKAEILKNIFASIRGIVMACAASFSILLIQLCMAMNPKKAVHHFILKLMGRTLDEDFLSPRENDIVTHFSTRQLLGQYLEFPCISFGAVQLSFGAVILIFATVSGVAYFLHKSKPQRSLWALLVTTWASILCPLSWILLARGHSATHLYTDPVVWHIPFTVLGSALTIVTFQTLLQSQFRKVRFSANWLRSYRFCKKLS